MNTQVVSGRRYGQVVPVEVVEVEGKPVAATTARGYLAMQAAAAKEGLALRLASGWRSNCEQASIHKAYTLGTGPFAFPPGYSRHQDGAALDLLVEDPRVLAWLERNAARFGFQRTIPGENWHWEFTGRGAGQVEGVAMDTAPTQRNMMAPASWSAVTYPQEQETVPLGAKVVLGLGVASVAALIVWSMVRE